jgi:hypothetical protein
VSGQRSQTQRELCGWQRQKSRKPAQEASLQKELRTIESSHVQDYSIHLLVLPGCSIKPATPTTRVCELFVVLLIDNMIMRLQFYSDFIKFAQSFVLRFAPI